jgi:hypothetical protein
MIGFFLMKNSTLSVNNNDNNLYKIKCGPFFFLLRKEEILRVPKMAVDFLCEQLLLSIFSVVQMLLHLIFRVAFSAD